MVTLTLGAFQFARYEIPEAISFGAAQKLNVHTLVGGARVIDAMGKIPINPSWSGWLVGQQALPRARYLKGQCEAGFPLPLTYSELSYNVIISEFKCEFRSGPNLPYSISLEVIDDNTSPITSVPAPSIEQLCTDDLNGAAGLAALIGDGGLIGAVASVQTALASVNNLAQAGLSQIHAILQPIAAAQAVAQSLLRTASTTLANVGNLASLGGMIPNPLSQFTTGLALGAVSSANSASLISVNRSLGRMATNLSSLTAGTASLTTGATDLFHVAATKYGDARAWTQIAAANGLTDPNIAGITTLVIPALIPISTGILNA
jgi:hypothetical protein